MEWPRKIVSLLKANDISSISFVPDSVIGRILKASAQEPRPNQTPVHGSAEGRFLLTDIAISLRLFENTEMFGITRVMKEQDGKVILELM